MRSYASFQADSWRDLDPPKRKKIKFARAVYCNDTWYIRLGSQHGVDVMFQERSEAVAKNHAKLINQSLNRDLRAKGA